MGNEELLSVSTDNRLARLIQPYSEKDIVELKEELSLKHGPQTIRIWNGKHLHEEHIYKICVEMGIDIELKKYQFACFSLAAAYVCKKQLLRQGLTNEYRKYLIGKEFNSSYEFDDGKPIKYISSKSKIANTIGTRLFVSSGTVIKYGAYAEAIDCIFDGDEDFAKEILLGHILVSHENIIELSRIKTEEIRSVAKCTKKNNIDHLTFADIRNGVKARYLNEKGEVSRSEKKNRKLNENIGIRQMPVFDPDSEVNSLCMTIGYWISSIQRVNNSVDFSRITTKARIQLVKELSFLERTVDNIQESLIERKNS